MNIDVIKELIKDEYISSQDAIWLIENIKIDEIKEAHNGLLFYYIEEILKLLKEKRNSTSKLSQKDDLIMYAIETKFMQLLNLDEDEIEDVDEEEYVSFDDYQPYTKKQLDEMKILSKKVLEQSKEQLLNSLINLIDTKFVDILNGFNKLEYSRAKRHFWKQTLGFEGFEYRDLPENVLKLLNDVYNSSEAIVRKKVEEREMSILPKVANDFAYWIEEYGYKVTKTNLKQFLKNNSIKLSNPNMDKILDDVKSR